MATGELTVKISLNTMFAMAWIRACHVLSWFIGPGALPLARWGAERLMLYRIDDGRWRRLRWDA